MPTSATLTAATEPLALARGALKAALLTVNTVAHETDIATIRAHLSGLRDGLRDALEAINANPTL